MKEPLHYREGAMSTNQSMISSTRNQDGRLIDYPLMTQMMLEDGGYQTTDGPLIQNTATSFIETQTTMMNSRFWFDMY